jgi:hypothetical protein
MKSVGVVIVAGFVAASALGVRPATGQGTGFAGRWVLDRGSSEFPHDIGFGADLVAGSVPDASGGAELNPTALLRRESEDDARRLRQLTDEARVPPERLTITDTATAVSLRDERGRLRTFHPGAREDVVQLDGVPVGAVARREAGRLVVTYHVEQGRDLRYTYSRAFDPPQLLVDLQFLERGSKGTVRRVYRLARPNEPDPPPPAPAAPSPAEQHPWTTPQAPGEPAAPARNEIPTLPPRPGDEFKGLVRLAVVLEDMGAQAAACGLKPEPIETAVKKSLTDAGLKIVANSDEDTYLYVNVNTSKVMAGFCVTRYDVALYTHTMARLPYGSAPALVQVSLLRDGGMVGGDAKANAESVLRGVRESVERFAQRVRDANK